MFAKSIRALPRGEGALIVGLDGELGSGKTAFTQDLARALGVRERVTSPTFVVMKIYSLPPRRAQGFRHLVHIDAYRLVKPHDLLALGLVPLLKDSENLIIIEWAERVRKLIPQNAVVIHFRHGEGINERIIEIHGGKTDRTKR